MKSMLCMLSHAPYAGSLSVEILEAAMVGAVFEFNVSILLRSEAVWMLQADQNGSLLGRRTPGNVITALPDYEIADIYACAEAITHYGIDQRQSIVPVTVLPLAQQSSLITSQDIVLGGSA